MRLDYNKGWMDSNGAVLIWIVHEGRTACRAEAPAGLLSISMYLLVPEWGQVALQKARN